MFLCLSVGCRNIRRILRAHHAGLCCQPSNHKSQESKGRRSSYGELSMLLYIYIKSREQKTQSHVKCSCIRRNTLYQPIEKFPSQYWWYSILSARNKFCFIQNKVVMFFYLFSSRCWVASRWQSWEESSSWPLPSPSCSRSSTSGCTWP